MIRKPKISKGWKKIQIGENQITRTQNIHIRENSETTSTENSGILKIEKLILMVQNPSASDGAKTQQEKVSSGISSDSESDHGTFWEHFAPLRSKRHYSSRAAKKLQRRNTYFTKTRKRARVILRSLILGKLKEHRSSGMSTLRF